MSVMKLQKPTNALVKCAFCGGRGKDPFGIMSRLSSCYACGGEGRISVRQPMRPCPCCHGSGVSPLGARNYCAACRGAGVVTLEESSSSCPNCHGTGLHLPIALYCNVCQGKGAIPVERKT